MSDDGFKPVTRDDTTDLALLPGEFRAFRSEVRDGLESIARTLQTLGRIEERMTVVIERQNFAEQRVDKLERRLDAVQTEQIAIRELVDRLNANATKRRVPARKK